MNYTIVYKRVSVGFTHGVILSSNPIFAQLTRHESFGDIYMIHMSHVKDVLCWFHMGFHTRYIDISMSQAVGIFPLLSYAIFYYVDLSTSGDGYS